MKKIVFTLIAIFALSISSYTFGQIRKIPAAVTDSLKAKFPDAKNVSWGDRITLFEATFDLDEHKYQAAFTSEGNWKRTEIFLNDDEVPQAVKDGLDKSKYNDWQIQSYVDVTEAGGTHQYRLLAKKNEVQKKYLYFNTKGRLIKDTITL